MKKRVVGFLGLVMSTAGIAGLAMSATVPAKPVDPIPGDPLPVTMGSKKPVRVRVARNQATLIRLPDGQRVMNVYGGDKGEGGVWSVDAGKIPTRFLAVKPKETGIHTTLHVISNTGQELSFYLEEVTGQETQFDAEVDAESNSDANSSPIASEIKWVPAEDVASCKSHTEALQKDVTAVAKTEHDRADAAITAFQVDYPKKLRFNFDWDAAKAEKLGLERAWADDKFTYFRGGRVLALYEINEDGKPSLIQYSYADGLYTVPKLIYDGYFAIGEKKENKLTFHRSKS